MEEVQVKNGLALDRLKVIAYTVGTILFLFVGWSWYVNNHYTFVFDNNFKKSCMAKGGTESACICALNVTKGLYPYSTEKAYEQSGKVPLTLTILVQTKCA